jgi:hypothetical protein
LYNLFGPFGDTLGRHSLIGKTLFLAFMFSLAAYPRLASQATESYGTSPRAFDSIPIPDFRVGTTLPNIVPADGTTPATSIIFIIPINGFTGTVILSDPSPPADLTCTAIDPGTISNGSGHAMVSCSSSVAGTYNVTIVGTSDAIRHNAYFDIQVRNPPPPVRIHDIRYHSPELCRKLNSHLKRNSVFPGRI